MLPEDEVIDAIRADAWSAALLDTLPRYQRIQWDDLDHGEDCYESLVSDLECDTTPAESLSEGEFSAYVRLRDEAPPNAEVTTLVHSCVCQCGAELQRKSFQVALTVGAFRFTREYQAS